MHAANRGGQTAGHQSVLDEIKDGYAISDGAEHRVAVGREDEVALLVQRPAQVRKLQTEASDTTRHTHVRVGAMRQSKRKKKLLA